MLDARLLPEADHSLGRWLADAVLAQKFAGQSRSVLRRTSFCHQASGRKGT